MEKEEFGIGELSIRWSRYPNGISKGDKANVHQGAKTTSSIVEC